MKTALEQTDLQLLEELQQTDSATVQELCEALKITATAVRQRLSRLSQAECISRETVRVGRGRPHHAYRITERGLRQLGDNYGDLALLLWQELRHIDDAALRNRIADRVREGLIQRYGGFVEAGDLSQRLEQLRQSLSDRGFSVDVDQSGPLPILRENSCPYQELAHADSGICELEQQVFEKVLGVPLELTQCFRNGDHCCEFQPATANFGNGA